MPRTWSGSARTWGPTRSARSSRPASRPSMARPTWSMNCWTCTRPASWSALAAIIDRIETDLRAAPVLAALRLAFLHSILPSSRLTTAPGRTGNLHVANGHVKLPGRRAVARDATRGSRSRRPSAWCAASSSGSTVAPTARSMPGSARTCGAWGRGPRRRSSGCPARPVSGPLATDTLCADGRRRAAAADPARPGPAATSARPRPTRRHVPRHVLGPRAVRRRRSCPSMPWPARRCADRGAGRARRSDGPWRPWRPRWPATAVPSSSSMAAPEAVAAAALGGVGAGYRLISALARRPERRRASGSWNCCRPARGCHPAPGPARNVPLEPCRAAPAIPDVIHGRRLFAAPERFESRPFSAAEAARTVTEVAVETLRARGEPARWERLLGEILVGPGPGRPAPAPGRRCGRRRRRGHRRRDRAGAAADDGPRDRGPARRLLGGSGRGPVRRDPASARRRRPDPSAQVGRSARRRHRRYGPARRPRPGDAAATRSTASWP